MYINLPPPTGGLNSRDPLSGMAANDARRLVNWISDGEVVRSRGGSRTVLAQDITTVQETSLFPEFSDIIVEDLSGDIETLVEYDGGQTIFLPTTADNKNPTFIKKDNQLLICAGTKIWKYDDPPVELGSGFSNSRWLTGNFNNFLIFTNGVDAPQTFDGTTLTSMIVSSMNDAGGNATGDSTTNLFGSVLFKGRMFYWLKDKQYFYYADIGAFQGDLVQFDLGSQAKKGGYIVSIQTYSRDSGSGLDDYLAIFFSTGETILYQGDDPVNNWSLVNSYQLAPPINERGFLAMGGDVIVLTIDGWQNLSSSLPNQRLTNANQIGEKIINSAQRVAKRHGDKFGWDIVYYPRCGLLIINVPSQDDRSRQFVLSTKSEAWTNFRGWNAKSFVVFNDELYFADEFGNIRKADVGFNDNGQYIALTAYPAFQNFGKESIRKQICGAQVLTNFNHPKYISLRVDSDYNNGNAMSINYPPEYGIFDWDVSFWDEALWGGGDLDDVVKPPYKMVFGQGYALALNMRMGSRAQQIVWYSTNINLKKMGGK
ncbi:MAG: hypothetical protein L3J83_03700 [Proteobacteria bacterium]|nr:hypothetical protein [Pseudomonadota bacterium]